MKTIALRFSDSFAPAEGTIAEHNKLIQAIGYAWYGKLGTPVADRVCESILSNENPKVLLIHSGRAARYWMHIDAITRNKPEPKEIPEYYREQANSFSTWFRVRRIEAAEKNVMSFCTVASSGVPLSKASRSSMSPYFIIEYECNKRSKEGESVGL